MDKAELSAALRGQTRQVAVSMACVSIVILALIFLFAGCTNVKSQAHDFCLIAKPIYFKPGEAKLLSPETRAAIVKHDDSWEANCK